MPTNWSTHFRELLTNVNCLLFSLLVVRPKSKERSMTSKNMVPVYRCKQCHKEFIGNTTLDSQQITNLFQILNDPPQHSCDIIERFLRHRCTTPIYPKMTMKFGIAELVGFTDEEIVP